MRTTITGPYPRIGSELGDLLRKELNKKNKDSGKVSGLQADLTKEIIQELVSAGIELPNYGLVDVHDELTWPFEFADGIEFGGMKKIFKKNMHYKEPKVKSGIHAKPANLALYKLACQTYPDIKLELPGPYTLARHSVIGKDAPYLGLEYLTQECARVLRRIIDSVCPVTMVQFNEPSIIADEKPPASLDSLPQIYSRMLEGLNIPTAVWTFYGRYTQNTLELLFTLPVGVVGLDFVWHPEVAQMLKGRLVTQGIGFGIVDSCDRRCLHFENANELAEKIKRLEDFVDFDKSLVSSNATLRHLPRDYAHKKIEIISEVGRLVSK